MLACIPPQSPTLPQIPSPRLPRSTRPVPPQNPRAASPQLKANQLHFTEFNVKVEVKLKESRHASQEAPWRYRRPQPTAAAAAAAAAACSCRAAYNACGPGGSTSRRKRGAARMQPNPVSMCCCGACGCTLHVVLPVCAPVFDFDADGAGTTPKS